MSLIASLFALLSPGRSLAPAAPPVQGSGAIPVLAVGDVIPARPEAPAAAPLHPGGTLGPVADALQIEALLEAVEMADPPGWAPRLAGPMALRGIRSPRARAAFASTIAHESNGGRALEEVLSYSAERACAVWPSRFPSPAAASAYARNPERLANCVYAGRNGNGPEASGDGWRFRGRGLIQITGRANYAAAAKALAMPLLSDPDRAADPGIAASIAAWWWAAHGCNELAAAGDVTAWRRRVNGGLVGVDDVRRRYEAALSLA